MIFKAAIAALYFSKLINKKKLATMKLRVFKYNCLEFLGILKIALFQKSESFLQFVHSHQNQSHVQHFLP